MENCFAVEQNDCIYIVKPNDTDSAENHSYTENNFGFYVIEDGTTEPADTVEDSVDGAIAYEISFDDDNPFLDTEVTSSISLQSSGENNKSRQYLCPQCQSSFSRQYSLKVHMRTHTGEKPYKCTFDCHKSFATSGDLQRHVRTHTGDRPYKCSFEGCDFSFTTNANLRTHFRKHTGERPYLCGVEGCGKSFMQLTNFKNHQRVHTGEKPYECDECKKCFTEYATLYRHRLSHRKMKCRVPPCRLAQ